ncbi:uncharacterized protein Z518_00105 [Rhinocladiella mackenziei CBS 650.93]|uniref:Beta-lactamase-related domain-containing protein n=1 Tax=Rhinocladiella mackenziei CBS 650.93 TaxID=1442369 RepID=A0A0D2G3C3_9EURO|nr:uncharacterized protein Z518_00105 [Rhinocladiella mackenziei CBS 650.93]KIX09027.1 hypothetical protein Z518_00105 [Rhinocladiella mackenziei CBS 650.93]
MEAKLNPLFEAAVKEKRVPGIGAMVVDSKGNFLLKETFGTNNLADTNAASFDADTTMQMHSCTKLLTSIAALQLMEQGKLSLADPVEKFVPRISRVQVLESFTTGDQPQPILRTPKSKPTILQLLTHTAGFSYDIFDVPTLQFRMSTGRAPASYHTTGVWEDFETPLLADPGTKYIYGINTDWLGFVVQNVSGILLPEYIDQMILRLLGMNATSAYLTEGKERLLTHFNIDDKLNADPDAKNSETVDIWGGGAYIYSTMNDYAKLLATILNEGTSPETHNSILKPATIKEYLFTDHLPSNIDKSLLGEIGTSIPLLSSEGSFFPSLPISSRGWSCGLLLNHEDLPYGRKKGSGAWCGLGNLYYWIDPASNMAGMVCSAILPFFNPSVMKLFDQVERVAYGHDVSGPEDDGKGNHRIGPSGSSQVQI